MNPPLEIQKFILENKDWEEKLSNEPYNLKIVKEGNFVIFKYNQISSDMSYQICREARGLILYADKPAQIARIALDKFFNYGEQYATDIDWESAKIQEKIDGSIISLWIDLLSSTWKISTNGTIDANQAPLEFQTDEIKTFGDLAEKAFQKYDMQFPLQRSRYTYTFELCSPYNRVVVPYKDIELYHIATRDIITAEEVDIDIGVPKPKQFSFNSLDEVIEFSKTLDYSQEGFVVVDKDYNRIKVKGEDYLRVHKIKGETAPTPKNIVELILNEQDDDFIGLFPEYKEEVLKIKQKFKNLLEDLSKDVYYYQNFWKEVDDRKRFAVEFAKNTKIPGLFFDMKDGKVSVTEWDDYVKRMRPEKVLQLLKGK